MMLFRRKPSPEQVRAARLEKDRAAISGAVLHRVGMHRVAVMSPKGGVGKTITAAGIAHILAELRGEICAVVDANVHTGTLRRRLVPADRDLPGPVIELAELALSGVARPEWSYLASWHDLVGRMRVLSNEGADPAVVEAWSGRSYAALVELLSRAAQIVVQDLGTSLTGQVARAALDAADTLVMATDLTQDTLELTVEAMTALAGSPQSYTPEPHDWSAIDDGRYAPLVSGAVVVVNPSRDEDRDPADMEPLVEWLRQACGAVVMVPRDQHLAAGDWIDWQLVGEETVSAHMSVAAAVAGRFARRPLSVTRSGAE